MLILMSLDTFTLQMVTWFVVAILIILYPVVLTLQQGQPSIFSMQDTPKPPDLPMMASICWEALAMMLP